MRLRQRVEILERELESLRERTIQLKRRPCLLHYVRDSSCPYGWRQDDITGDVVMDLFKELYDHLGIERVTTPEVTKLQKKK